MRCCCLWLAEAYEAHGMLWHARTQYRRLLEINPFDEDILCRLMATLYRHGLLSDALSYYQEAKHRFTREGLSLSHTTKQLAEKLTNDPLSPELYLSFQLQSSQSHRSEQVLLQPSLPNARLLHLSIGDLSDAGRQALFLAGLQERWTVGEMNSMLDRILKEYSDMTWKEQKEKAVSRRDVLMLLTGMSSSLLGLTRVGDTSPFLAEEILSLCLTAIPACWNLVYADGIPHVEQVLPQYLMHLTDIAQRSSRCQKQAASLASQGHKLANLLALRREDFLAALKHSKDAWIYGQLAEDLNLQLAALIEEALTFWYRKRPLQTLTTYQKALQLIPREDQASGRHNSISPIIAGRVYAGLAEAYAQLGQEQEALQYMGLAQDTFPEYPENDPHFAYTYYDHYYLYLYQGLMYMKLNQPNQALSTYAYFNAPKYSSRRVEILNREAAALLASDDMHQCCTKVEAAVALAISAKSDLRYSEAYEVHQRMLIKWPHERKVKSLAQIFQLEDRHG